MKINFVTQANDQLASFRYHNSIPARELSLLGHQADVTAKPLLDSDVYVFSKHFDYSEYLYALGLKNSGKKVAFHACDSHFGGMHDEHYRRMLNLADVVIVPTPAMADKVMKETGVESEIIPDTFEFPEDYPHFKNTNPLRVLWFGHIGNLSGLEKLLPLPDFCELRLCTRVEQPLPLAFEGLKYQQWSYSNMINSLQWASVVIIPLNLDKDRNGVKSANRLVEAVRRGCFVIASPIESYQAYSEWMYIGDIPEGLNWLKEQTNEDINKRIKSAQTYISETISPAVIGKRWEEALCQ